jgi:hypothetical protein
MSANNATGIACSSGLFIVFESLVFVRGKVLESTRELLPMRRGPDQRRPPDRPSWAASP